MVVPVGKEAQEFIQVDKDMEGKVKKTKLLEVRYIPLTSVEAQCPDCRDVLLKKQQQEKQA